MFYASFEKFSDLSGAFDGTVDSISDTDPFPDTADSDRTGMDTRLDNLEDADPFEGDSEEDEIFEDIDEDDIEPGEDVDEEGINEVDLDFGPEDLEPDWSPDDDVSPADEATGTSHEDESADTQIDDNKGDQWEEVSPNEEISQDDDVIEDDDISQLEETVEIPEPLIYPDENDLDQDLTDEAVEDITYIEHLDDPTDDAMGEIEDPGQGLLDAGTWVDNLEDFLDFTEQDVSSFHEVSDGYEITDGYDPPYPDFMGDEIIELPNLVDDVFADIFPDPINDPFSWFDSFE